MLSLMRMYGATKVENKKKAAREKQCKIVALVNWCETNIGAQSQKYNKLLDAKLVYCDYMAGPSSSIVFDVYLKDDGTYIVKSVVNIYLRPGSNGVLDRQSYLKKCNDIVAVMDKMLEYCSHGLNAVGSMNCSMSNYMQQAMGVQIGERVRHISFADMINKYDKFDFCEYICKC